MNNRTSKINASTRLAAFFTLIFSAPAFSQLPPDLHTIQITYEKLTPIQNSPIAGALYEKTIVRSIDFATDRMRIDTRAKNWKIRGPAPQIEIYDGDTVSTVDHERPIILNQRKLMNRPEGPVWKATQLAARVGTEAILGRPCAVYTNGGDWTIWVWNDLMLKETMGSGKEMSTTEATEIVVNPNIEKLISTAGFTFWKNVIPKDKQNPIPASQSLSFPDKKDASNNPNDRCRLDFPEGSNITRQFYETKEECLEKLCNIYGFANSAKGTTCQCLFDGIVVATYDSGKSAAEVQKEGDERLKRFEENQRESLKTNAKNYMDTIKMPLGLEGKKSATNWMLDRYGAMARPTLENAAKYLSSKNSASSDDRTLSAWLVEVLATDSRASKSIRSR